MNIKKHIVLDNGISIPSLGFGTWQIKNGKEAYDAVFTALEAGYRHIDTAAAYQNEESVGRAIRDFGLRREEIFLTTKLRAELKGYDVAMKELEMSLEKLETDYVDLYLIHAPKPWGTKGDGSEYTEANIDSWKAFIKLYEEGKDVGALLKSDLFSDVKTKKILCQAEFKNSAGQTIKQNLEINFEKNSKENGNEVFAKAIISDENLGLNVVSLKVNTEDMLFKFSLKNEEFGINMVIDPNKPAKEVKALAGKSIPDGVYTFICRMGLPNGIAKEEKIEAFVAGNEISISPNSFNPLVFTNGDYGIANFKKGISLVKVINSRSTAITVFIPADYASVANRNIESSIQTEAFSKQGSGWKSYVVPAGGSIKMKLKISSFPIIIYDLNRKTSEIIQVGLVSKNFQILTLGWGDSFSLK